MRDGAPAIMDIEASAMGAGSYPIEVGVALPEGITRCFLIRPEPEWRHWDPEAERVHGITRETLERHGLPARTVAETLNGLLEGRVVYSDAWGFDSSWLALLYHHAGARPSYRLEALRGILTEEQAEAWHDAKRVVIEHLDARRHRASIDALILQRTYVETRAHNSAGADQSTRSL